MGVITHAKVSGKPDGIDPSMVQPSDWDANHVIAPGTINTTDLGGDITAAGKALLDDANAAAQLTTLGAQPVDATLTALAGLNSTAGLVEQTGADAFTKRAIGVGASTSIPTKGDLAAVALSGSGGDLTAGSVTTTQLATAAQSGRYLGKQILTGAGSGNLASGTCVVRLRGIGQGGGGGGGGGSGSSGFGAGGSSGAMLDIWIGTPGTALGTLAISWTAGSAAGGGGANTGGAGTAGSDSTITINSVTYTMKGGGGGGGMASPGSSAAIAISSAPASGTTSGGVVSYGLGGAGLVMPSQAAGFGGHGGSSPLGAGGAGRATSGAGTAGDSGGFGGGGGGGVGGNVGGAGAAGGFVLEQYT